ncbi:hypothetical protein D9615_000923 [Tricholomella constricta]|uniref:Glutaredoxin domain-containing protein n=1 Tax=Tricholomella constricta TaxID=117010 RepID=A0A8H5M8L1_9AGAR|nr:hypothetical protein D9615_000923 [Tricholomella constricta]
MFPRLYNCLSFRRPPRTLSTAFFSSLYLNRNHMSIQQLVDTAIVDNKITIFSKSWCPYCKKAKALFAEEFPDVEAKVFELDERDDGAAIQDYLLKKSGQRTVPNVYVNGEHVGGSDDVRASFNQGALTKLVRA